VTNSLPCQTAADPDVFFPEDAADLATAQSFCAQCGYREKCLQVAIKEGIGYGVWGGQLFDRGQIVAAKRRQGRPPADIEAIGAELVAIVLTETRSPTEWFFCNARELRQHFRGKAPSIQTIFKARDNLIAAGILEIIPGRPCGYRIIKSESSDTMATAVS
jgi:WhiB family redox-sensing transcriptional regulator